jgi:hypothetical protein
VPPTKDLPSNEPEHVLVDGNCLDLRDNAGVPSDEKSGDDNTKDNERIRIDDPPLGEQTKMRMKTVTVMGTMRAVKNVAIVCSIKIAGFIIPLLSSRILRQNSEHYVRIHRCPRV